MESVPNEGENENQEATQEDSGDENEGEAESSEDLTVLSTAKEITRDLTEPWRKVWHRTSAVESIMALFLIPVTLISIEATVDSQAWALPLSAETIFQLDILPLAFTSSFVHAGPPYLWGNVHGYLLIMSALFPLAVLAGRKRELLLSSLCNLLLVPFLVSWASLILPSNKSALGFSGVNAAFLGTLIVFIFLAWNSEQKNVHPFWSLAIGLISLAVAFAFAPIVSPRLLFLTKFVAGFGIVGTVLVFLFVRRNGTKSVLSFSPYRNSVLFWGALIGIFGFAGLFVLVPPSTNVLAHLTGFYLGFFLPFSVLVGRTLNKPIVEKAMELRGKR